MSVWEQFKIRLIRFMSGRYGMDALSRALMAAGLSCLVLAFIPALRLLTLPAYALLIWMIFRTYSRNHAKRRAENAWFLAKTKPLASKAKQAVKRLKNSKQFHYYRCPECKTLLKLPRGVGEVTITCRGCGHKFDKKA